jgi:integrase
MPRPVTGAVVEKQTSRGTSYALRFRALGARQFVHLGYEADGWTWAKAQDELTVVTAQVRRGAWSPPAPAPVVDVAPDPTFHEFASEWLHGHSGDLAQTTADNYGWQLTHHLLPFFKDHRLSEITVREVDRYRASKVREVEQRHRAIEAATQRRQAAVAAAIKTGASVRAATKATPMIDADGYVLRPLSASSINKSITRLAQILEVAVEYDLIARNPAKGRNRRAKVTRTRPVYLDSADQIACLLRAAGELDAGKGSKTDGRRALVATLVYAGLRITEACELRWRDVDLATGTIKVGRAKTPAGLRDVDILPALRDELSAYKAQRRRAGGQDLVFTTRAGTPRDKDNARERVLRPVVKHADKLLADDGVEALPRITPHKLRHTFASILFALGWQAPDVMAQLGHTDPAFTLRVYAHVMRRGADERDRLRVLVEGDTGTEEVEVERQRSSA